jgi:hypothetical protein
LRSSCGERKARCSRLCNNGGGSCRRLSESAGHSYNAGPTTKFLADAAAIGLTLLTAEAGRKTGLFDRFSLLLDRILSAFDRNAGHLILGP